MRHETMQMDGVRWDMSMCKNKKTDRDPKQTATTTTGCRSGHDDDPGDRNEERSGGGGWSDSLDRQESVRTAETIQSF